MYLTANPTVIKSCLMSCSKAKLIEHGQFIKSILMDETGLTSNERQCLIQLYKFCQNQYKKKYLSKKVKK